MFLCSLAGEIRKFSDLLRQWMEVALKGLPESLQEAKYKGIVFILTPILILLLSLYYNVRIQYVLLIVYSDYEYVGCIVNAIGTVTKPDNQICYLIYYITSNL